ncbi:hypothetical protein RHMOL_Rhmol11G0012200 [Rhododendron molle]|uniref:Uncharacterized protein n=1 Tax=Rhododendron molle TaxID=49168 RepID=A0ACC0LMG8_RHOML|nr:hypothetical protein RHMOL_Rhmol11G0012200 [Rhododendron molle]
MAALLENPARFGKLIAEANDLSGFKLLLQQIYVAAVQNITSLSFVEIYEVLSIVSGCPSAALIAVVPRQMSSLPSAFSEKNVIIRLLGCFEAQFCCC